jgi:branched-subunit amino acid ABC-type transport system permease component
VVVVGALLGLVIERFGLRPLQGNAHIAPLLATIGISGETCWYSRTAVSAWSAK